MLEQDCRTRKKRISQKKENFQSSVQIYLNNNPPLNRFKIIGQETVE